MALNSKFHFLILLCFFGKTCYADLPVISCLYKDSKFEYGNDDQYQCNMQKDFTFMGETTAIASGDHDSNKNNDDVLVLTIVRKNIFQIPDLSTSFSKLSYINIRYTSLRYLKRTNIAGYKANLVHLSIINSNIEIIDQGLLEGFDKLETIDLQYNKIFYIHGSAFTGLNLKVLKLKGNGCNVGSDDIENYEFILADQELTEYLTKISISTCKPSNFDELFLKYLESKTALDFEAYTTAIENEEFLLLKDKETEKCKKSLDSAEEAKNTIDGLLIKEQEKTAKLESDVKVITSKSESCKANLEKVEGEVKGLKDEIQKLELAGEKCLDIKGTCRFTKDPINGYSCIARNITIDTPGTEIDWSGDHNPTTMKNQNVVTLLIRDLNVQYVPKNIVDKFFRLQNLIIDKSGLKKLSKNDFLKLYNLLTIQITSNNISSVDSGTFDDALSLQTLDLSDNKIQSLPSKIFAELDDLLTLKLDKNQFTTLKADLIAAANYIEHFSATENKLASVESTFVWRLKSARLIDFSGNSGCNKKYDQKSGNSYIVFYGSIITSC